MSHFYASVTSKNTTHTKAGHATTGMRSHLRGWNVGVKVVLQYNEDTKKDEIHIYKTGGSIGASQDQFITTITED